MLKELRVKNFAIIDELSLTFGPGLNILTGETGAGKSIIIGALGITLGQRAYTEMIKTGSKEALVEAYFEMPRHPLLDRLGIDSSGGVIIRRNISAAGKARAYINDTMVNVQTLAELGKTLVDIHGQHDHQSLLSTDNQMRLLDHYGRLEGERAAVAAMFEEVQKLRRRVEEIRQNARERAQRLDLLRFQINEIESASVTDGEDDRLEEQRQILSNLNRLNELIESSYGLLYSDEGSCLEKLSTAESNLKEMASIDQGVSGMLETLKQAVPLVEDAALSIRDLRDRYDMDPGRLAETEDRLELIKGLKRKYGDTVGAVLKYGEDAAKEAKAIEHSDETAEALQKEMEEKEARLREAASALSEKRKTASGRLQKAIKEVFEGLALEKSDFSVSLQGTPISSAGIDALEFLFSANRGEDPKPLGKVASGGELSRIMLAIKSVMRGVDDIPVLVFDEVDAGIGGKTAQNVARKLKDISCDRQVLCITHLPQIASLAQSHYLIEKGIKNNKVYVNVKEISGRPRQEEIARMLSGSVTETSLEHAREIIERTA
jgi:DNA repair protein RecN (Recombination protein N)